MSGEAGGQTKQHCKQLGAAGYFEKPIDFDALRACLRAVAKSRVTTTRGEVRVRLRVPLKLRWRNGHGDQSEESAATENVSMNGFLCVSSARLDVNSTVDVYLTTPSEKYTGKAKILNSEAQGAVHRYGCVFLERTGPWVLQ